MAKQLESDGSPSYLIAIVRDDTERDLWEQQFAHMAGHDPLTGLSNRRILGDALARSVARAQRKVSSALLFMDVDNFKIVNDTLGHVAGDRVLVTVTELIQSRPRGGDLLARIGGYEFAVLLEVTDVEGARGAAERIRGDVAFFQTVRAALAKPSGQQHQLADDLDHAIRQIISRAIYTGDVVDIFAAAGLKKPDISILSDEFLAEVQGLPHRNLAVELLNELLANEIKTRSRANLVRSRSFSDMLERAIRAYQNRAMETSKIIEALIELAKQMREADRQGEQLGLTDDEVAFYEALEVNDGAVTVLGGETLKAIARELVDTVGKNVTIYWTVKESVRAKLRTMVKRVLRKYGYPPDKQEKAMVTVLEQAELLGLEWAA